MQPVSGLRSERHYIFPVSSEPLQHKASSTRAFSPFRLPPRTLLAKGEYKDAGLEGSVAWILT